MNLNHPRGSPGNGEIVGNQDHSMTPFPELFKDRDDILSGNGRAGLADTIALNAAAAFMVVEKVDSLGEGCALAREIMLGGALRSWLEKAQAFYSGTAG